MLRFIGQRESYRQSKRVLLTKVNSDILLMTRHKSYYTSLGLNSNASPQDIKAAYYKLSLKYHPDKNQGSAESVEKFREITEAYETLSNLSKKTRYDESLSSTRYSGYGEAEWRRDHYSPRSYPYADRRSKPRTGRSEYYNYDEHYKQHYGEYEKRRQAEYEYFKQRWEADFKRRYPNAGKPDWSEYERKQREHFNFNWKDPNMSIKSLLPRRYFVFVFTAWIITFVILAPFIEAEPINKASYKPSRKTPPGPIYYRVKDDEEKDVETNET